MYFFMIAIFTASEMVGAFVHFMVCFTDIQNDGLCTVDVGLYIFILFLIGMGNVYNFDVSLLLLKKPCIDLGRYFLIYCFRIRFHYVLAFRTFTLYIIHVMLMFIDSSQWPAEDLGHGK